MRTERKVVRGLFWGVDAGLMRGIGWGLLDRPPDDADSKSIKKVVNYG
jgi:hypothetical protein